MLYNFPVQAYLPHPEEVQLDNFFQMQALQTDIPSSVSHHIHKVLLRFLHSVSTALLNSHLQKSCMEVPHYLPQWLFHENLPVQVLLESHLPPEVSDHSIGM